MLDPLYWLAAHAIIFFHGGFGPIFGDDSFFAWAFSVVLLVIVVRIMIFPLFVKQVKSQRKMQMMQPLIKEIKEKWGHDKQRMQQEMLNLQREHGNPLLGCLPLLLQIPVFFAMFHVFNSLKPVENNGVLTWVSRVDLPAETVRQIAEAKFLGISMATAFTSGEDYLSFIVANGTNVKIASVLLILLMGTTTFLTQKQIMARTGPVDPQQAMIQKFLLYGSPIMLAVFGFKFPIAVLLYWLTTNLWSMGQQYFVIKKMPPLRPAAAGGPGAKTPGARPASGASGGAAAVSRPKPGVKPKQGPKRASAAAMGANAARGGTQNGTAASEVAGTASGGSTRASQARRGSGAAPPGTRSPRGVAAGGATPGTSPKDKASPKAKAKDGDVTRSVNITKGADSKGADSRGGGSSAVPPDSVDSVDSADSADSVDSADSAGSADAVGAAGTPEAAGSAGAGGSSSNGSTPGEAAKPTQRSTNRPVGAGARRQPAGSRPAKRRGKNKRPGGRR